MKSGPRGCPEAARQTAAVLDLQPAVAEDARSLLALREEAARWLRERGIDQWRPGEVGPATFAAQIAAGEWFVHRVDGAVRGALRLLWADPRFWGPRPDDAGYVHGLVIDRDHAGQGLGVRLLDWAGTRTREAGRAFLRLDCAADNEQLRSYYRRLGFEDRGRRRVGDWSPVMLFEKPVTQRTRPEDGPST